LKLEHEPKHKLLGAHLKLEHDPGNPRMNYLEHIRNLRTNLEHIANLET